MTNFFVSQILCKDLIAVDVELIIWTTFVGFY